MLFTVVISAALLLMRREDGGSGPTVTEVVWRMPPLDQLPPHN
jgi:hypothetical protein